MASVHWTSTASRRGPGPLSQEAQRGMYVYPTYAAMTAHEPRDADGLVPSKGNAEWECYVVVDAGVSHWPLRSRERISTIRFLKVQLYTCMFMMS